MKFAGMLLAAVLILIPTFIACGERGDKPPSGTTDNGTGAIKAETVPQPGEEETAGTAKEQKDYTVGELIKDWPDDVPLLEPYSVTGYLPDSGGYKQVSILVDNSFEYVFNAYSKVLFEDHGWEPDEESKKGVPELFLSFNCRKDNRELSVMMKSEDDGEKTLVQFGITDLEK